MWPLLVGRPSGASRSFCRPAVPAGRHGQAGLRRPGHGRLRPVLCKSALLPPRLRLVPAQPWDTRPPHLGGPGAGWAGLRARSQWLLGPHSLAGDAPPQHPLPKPAAARSCQELPGELKVPSQMKAGPLSAPHRRLALELQAGSRIGAAGSQSLRGTGQARSAGLRGLVGKPPEKCSGALGGRRAGAGRSTAPWGPGGGGAWKPGAHLPTPPKAPLLPTVRGRRGWCCRPSGPWGPEDPALRPVLVDLGWVWPRWAEDGAALSPAPPRGTAWWPSCAPRSGDVVGDRPGAGGSRGPQRPCRQRQATKASLRTTQLSSQPRVLEPHTPAHLLTHPRSHGRGGG